MPRPGPVLIVSDDPVLRDLLRDLLERERVRAEEVQTADEVLALCRDRQPAFLLLDAIVDERPTLTLLSRLQFARPDGTPPRVVLLTGSAPSQELVSHDLVTESIGAPFATPALLHVVRQLLAGTGSSHTRLRAATDAVDDDKASGDDT